MRSEELRIRYRDKQGTPLISVTQVLTLTGRIDTQWYSPEAAQRGSLVHAITEAIDRGDAYEVPPALQGYIDAYLKFLRHVRPVYNGIEVAMADTSLGFAGRIDRDCQDLFGMPGILDFKTGPPSSWHGQQLAAYNALLPRGTRWACYLKKNGAYKLVEYTDAIDYRRFEYDLARIRGRLYPNGDFWSMRRSE